MKYPEMQRDIVEEFAEAQVRWHSWRGDDVHLLSGFNVMSEELVSRKVEYSNTSAKQRIRQLDEYKRRLLAGERPKGLNIKRWQQAAMAIGIELKPTQPGRAA